MPSGARPVPGATDRGLAGGPGPVLAAIARGLSTDDGVRRLARTTAASTAPCGDLPPVEIEQQHHRLTAALSPEVPARPSLH